MTVGPIEVGNMECKRVGASKAEVACQFRKNIKINKSILLQLEEYDLECPLLLSIHGEIKKNRKSPTAFFPTKGSCTDTQSSRHIRNVRDRVPGTKVERHLGGGQGRGHYCAADNRRRVQAVPGGHCP